MIKTVSVTPGLEIKDIFLRKINKSSGIFGDNGKYATECWVWTGSKYSNGYGKLGFKKKIFRAHRLSWTIYIGPIPIEQFVLHKCDYRACVNPDHLFLGTYADNLQDMIKKGRGKGQIPAGEDHPGSKLTWPQIATIRRWWKQGVKQKDLAKIFDIRPQTIQLIVHNKIWRS